MKLQRLTIDFAPQMPHAEARIPHEAYLLPAFLAAAAFSFLAWLLRE